ncbi:MAG: ChrR family anti-sigma-E factor [Alphaproteobacteria bacterium]
MSDLINSGPDNDSYSALIFAYASGCLNEAESLIVSSHVALSSRARNLLRSCEQMGGAILVEECQPVSMNEGALDSVLGRLGNVSDDSEEQKGLSLTIPEMEFLPDILQTTLCQKVQQPRWKRIYSGFSSMEIVLDCTQSKARLMKIDPAVKTPHHSHSSQEITLVLDGAFEDEQGRYHVGDLVIREENSLHAPVACAQMGCVCMVVSSGPVKMTGWARLFNPFLRM